MKLGRKELGKEGINKRRMKGIHERIQDGRKELKKELKKEERGFKEGRGFINFPTWPP